MAETIEAIHENGQIHLLTKPHVLRAKSHCDLLGGSRAGIRRVGGINWWE